MHKLQAQVLAQGVFARMVNRLFVKLDYSRLGTRLTTRDLQAMDILGIAIHDNVRVMRHHNHLEHLLECLDGTNNEVVYELVVKASRCLRHSFSLSANWRRSTSTCSLSVAMS